MDITEELLKRLNKMDDEKGVPQEDSIIDKNVLRDNDPVLNKDNTKSSLSSKERKKLTEVFTLFSQVFLDFKKKERLENRGGVVSSALKQTEQKDIPIKKEKSSWCDFLGMLAGGALMVAGAIPMLVGAMFAQLGPVADTLKTLGKMGLMGGLEMIKRSLLKVFGTGSKALKVLKKLPLIGSVVNFYLAYENFKDGRFGKGIWELVSGFLNFIPGIGPFLSIGMDILGTYLEYKGVFGKEGFSFGNVGDLIKGWGVAIGKKIWDNALWIPILGGIKRMGMAKEKFASGDFGGGLSELVKGLASFGFAPLVRGYEVLAGFLSGKLAQEPAKITEDSSWSDKMVEWIRSKLKVLPWWIKKPLAWFGIIPDDMAGDNSVFSDITGGVKKGFEKTKQFIGGIWDNVKGPMGDSVNTVRNFAVETWEKTKEFSANAWDSIKETAPKIWSSIKDASSSAWDSIKETAPKIWSSIKDASSSAWDGITDISDKAWKEIKEVGSVFSDGIKTMAKKTKDLVSNWIPGVMEAIGGMADSAIKLLRQVARKIGKWISGLFSDDEKSEMEKNRNPAERSNSDKLKAQLHYSKANYKVSGTQLTYMKLLYSSAQRHTELLTELVNIERSALNHLKNMKGGGGNPPSVSLNMPTPSQSSPLVPVGDNRNGYMSSPYALG